MNISGLKIGILHSLIGKNDGVSIVIDQTIEAMIQIMKIPLGNIHLLAAHSPPRFNTKTHDIFWHKNEQNKYILAHYSEDPPPEGFREYIQREALIAKGIISKWVDDHELDLFIVHNSCHPSNFVYAVAVGMYFEELAEEGRATPKFLLWWHDSHFERKRFQNPNPVIKEFLKYIPGKHVNGIVFINTEQEQLARKYYGEQLATPHPDTFFQRKTVFVPNTCDIPWDWQASDPRSDQPIAPPEDQYNRTFFKDIGLLQELEDRGRTLEEAVILLQHTRVVERKRIDHSIDFAIAMEEKFMEEGKDKVMILLVSGHSGDEHDSHLLFLKEYFAKRVEEKPKLKDKVILLFAENYILSEREVLVEKKYYRFRDVPSIIARHGGMGTYFSEVEGYGNNLLEMISFGLPVVINRYPIYKKDIAPLGFRLPSTENGELTEDLIDECYGLLTDMGKRNRVVHHNLSVLNSQLHHGVVAEKLEVLFKNMFRYH